VDHEGHEDIRLYGIWGASWIDAVGFVVDSFGAQDSDASEDIGVARGSVDHD
jgi:hypothetical protein